MIDMDKEIEVMGRRLVWLTGVVLLGNLLGCRGERHDAPSNAVAARVSSYQEVRWELTVLGDVEEGEAGLVRYDSSERFTQKAVIK
jgi:hypothetical protein